MTSRGGAHSLLWVAALLLGIYGCALAAVTLMPDGAQIAPWWPAAGLAVALLAVSPRPHWWALVPAVAVAEALAQVTAGGSPVAAGTVAGVHAVAALAAGWWLTRRVSGSPGLRDQGDVARLLTATLLSATLAAVGAALTALLVLDADWLDAAGTAFASHGAAILVIVPLVLGVDRRDRQDDSGEPWPRGEGAAQWAVFLATSLLVFGPDQTLALAFLPVVVLAWAALRVGSRTVTWQLLAVAVFSTVATERGWGPLAVDDPVTAAPAGWLVQAFVVGCAVVTLPLAVAVAQRRSAVHALRASEELFRKTFDESLVGMLVLRRVGGGLIVEEANAVAAETLGLTPDQLEGREWTSMLATPTPIMEVVIDLLGGRRDSWREELALEATPWRRVAVSLAPLSGAQDDRLFTAQMMDVTARHDATARLRTEKDLTSAILDTTGCLIVVVALDGTVVGINRAAQSVTGFGDEDVRDRPLWETLTPDETRTTVQAMFKDPDGAAVPTSQESDLRTRNGGLRRVVWSNAFLTDDRHRRTHVVMTGIDVTSQRATTGLLTHLLGAAAKTAFIGTDLNGRITVFNAGAEKLFGYPAREMVARNNPEVVLDPEQLAERARELGVRPGFAVLAADAGDDGQPHTRDWKCVRKDGASFTAALTLSAVKDAVGRHIGYLAVGEDVTEQRHSETRLRAALEKERAAVGLLTLSTLDTEATAPDLEPLDLRGVVAHCHEVLQPTLADRDLQIGLDLPEATVSVRGDRDHLERMVDNLLSNAVKFTEDGGKVCIKLRMQGDDAVLEVTDTGIGIPEGEQQELFTRFFRTSAAQERSIDGAGLGLSVVESVVRSHGGDVTVRSEHLQGSTFTVRIPLSDQRAPYVGSHAAR